MVLSLKLWLCLILIVSSFSDSESRSLGTSPKKDNRTLMRTAQQVLQASIERQAGRSFESKRVSPGGPDPSHH
ncbi:CLAVATA3/ESR (CLE)-related protein [Trema orientale]|uniref:CLAVATA3/ESR (CLE)-related protein n=1 Tax=Trema orientale TaxID=63057 RepID=A0A2P5FKV9_TREOI|nr:CLAVATA3/ESR (CLE)-related protein [Trema orientale]